MPVADVAHPEQARIRLAVNGDTRQDSSTAAMIWSVPEIISELSKYYELQAGDLIFTGTPSGVSAVNVGDQLLASIDGIGELRVELV
jgi:fumarylpyruvate hydrolase